MNIWGKWALGANGHLGKMCIWGKQTLGHGTRVNGRGGGVVVGSGELGSKGLGSREFESEGWGRGSRNHMRLG